MNILINKLKNKLKAKKEKSEEKMISLKDFSEYCKKHSLLIALTIFILLLAHGSNLFYNNIGIDTQSFIENPTFEYNWLGIGRYGLLIEKVLLGLSYYCPYYASIIFMLFLVVSNVILYYTFYKLSDKDFGLLNLCIPMLAFTHPVFVEQFVYMLQSAEIAFAISLTALSTLFIFTWIKDKNGFYCILGIVGLVICFATYQAFVPLYIAFCIFAFIMMFENNKNSNERNFKTIFKLIITFAISLIAYKVTVKLLPSYSAYIDDSFFWGNYPLRTIYEFITGYMKDVIIGRGGYFNKGYIIGSIFLLIVAIYKLVKSKEDLKISEKILYILSILAFIGTPFYMIIAIGHAPFLRAQFILPFTEAFIIMYVSYYLFKNKTLKYIAIIGILFVFEVQMVKTQNLYYTDHMRNESDIQTAYEMSNDIKKHGIVEGNRIAIVGHRNAKLNPVCQIGETVGVSLFTMNYYAPPYYLNSTSGILRLFRCLGIMYYECSAEEMQEARKTAQDMPVWPEEGSIKECNNYVIVKISEDELPLE